MLIICLLCPCQISINIEFQPYFMPVACLSNAMSSGGDWLMAKNVTAFSMGGVFFKAGF